MDNNSLQAIKVLASGIEKHIDTLNALNKSNILDYRLNDLIVIETCVKVCVRCKKSFIPKFNSRNTQMYCSDDCRYNSTMENRKVYKQDNRYHKIDCLRKLIYEMKYRARRDSKPLSTQREEAFEEILIDLKSLTKDRKHIIAYEFNKRYDELHKKYNTIKSW